MKSEDSKQVVLCWSKDDKDELQWQKDRSIVVEIRLGQSSWIYVEWDWYYWISGSAKSIEFLRSQNASFNSCLETRFGKVKTCFTAPALRFPAAIWISWDMLKFSQIKEAIECADFVKSFFLGVLQQWQQLQEE